MNIPSYISAVLDRLAERGFEAYTVGGCVRDSIMGKQPHDYDVTTSALPEEVRSVFSDLRVIDTGIKHGTVTVLSEGEPVEITTFRVDGEYLDGRHPESVEFTRSLSEDLSRRDFTMNGIAYSPQSGFVDLFGGTEDIKNGIIRCIGDPEQRFNEDALRIMRALRFSSVLGFDIEDGTARSIHKNAELLKMVSAERIFSELKQLLNGANVAKVLLDFSDVLCVIIPELSPCVGYEQCSKFHRYTVYEHSARAVAAAEPITELRLAMLLHDIGKPSCRSTDENGEGHYYQHAQKSAEMSQEIFARLKSDNATRALVCEIIKHHDAPLSSSRRSIRRQLSKHGHDLFVLIVKAHIADDMAKMEFCRERIPQWQEITSLAEELSQDSGLTIASLAVNGADLAALVKPSPVTGQILRHLLDCVIDETLPNEHGALMREAEEYLKALPK